MSGKAFDPAFIISFVVILVFTIFLDVMDFIWELIGVPLRHARSVTLIAAKSFSASLDVITSIVIGGWTYWAQRRGAKGKGEEAETPREKSEAKTTEVPSTETPSSEEEAKEQKSKSLRERLFSRKRPKKATKRIGKKATMSALRTSGVTLIGEVLPIAGMAPFWTLTVIKTFISVIREK